MFNRKVTYKEFLKAARIGGIAGLATVLIYGSEANDIADINKTTEACGCTALIRAARCGHIAIVNALLAMPGIDINKPDPCNDTPLIWAAYNGHTLCVIALLSRITNVLDIKRVNRSNRNAIQEAELKGHPEIAALIRARILELKAASLTFSQRIKKLEDEGHKVIVPDHLICPLSLGIMDDPISVSSGKDYDRQWLRDWFKSNNNAARVKCPATNERYIYINELENATSVNLKNQIRKFVEEQEAIAKAKLDVQVQSIEEISRQAASVLSTPISSAVMLTKKNIASIRNNLFNQMKNKATQPSESHQERSEDMTDAASVVFHSYI